jgi:hypothetical protein
LRLALLAPTIVEAILAARTDQALMWISWSGRYRQAGRSSAGALESILCAQVTGPMSPKKRETSYPLQ